jgi:uncharacterized FlaG/YvyC family protein
MQIPANPVPDAVSTEPSAPTVRPTPNTAPQLKQSTGKTVQTVSEVNPTPPISIPDATNVTFRRDSSGQIYYVLTDSKSGKELREIPPEEVRKVGEGIADYLRQEQEKSTPHIQVKA